MKRGAISQAGNSPGLKIVGFFLLQGPSLLCILPVLIIVHCETRPLV